MSLEFEIEVLKHRQYADKNKVKLKHY